MQRFASTKLFKVIMLAAIFGMLVLANPKNIFDPVRAGFLSVLSPFQKVFYSIAIGSDNVREFVGSIGQLKRENEDLTREKQELLAQNAMLKDSENENADLRQQIGLLPRGQYNLVAASVVSQDPNGTGNWLEIDRGSDDGIVSGMPVIVSKGVLLGRIQEVNAKNSKIILLTNPKSTVNVSTIENGAKGVVKGEYGLGIIFDMILQTDTIKVGDNVITSGVGGELPRGLYVGTVQEIHPSDDNLFQQAVVTSPLQISKLQMVFVVKSSK